MRNTVRLSVAPLLSLACAAALQAQSPPQIAHERVSVAATNDEWTPTTTTVAEGDLLLVEAEGRITVGRVVGQVGADGHSSGAGRLMLKIGTGAGQRVGAHAFIRAGEAGQVKLRVNDNRYADNDGTFTVSVIHIPAGLIPPAKIE